MTRVQSGLEILLQRRSNSLQRARVGVLCHAASVDSNLRNIVDLLSEQGVNIHRLFGPEHGLAATAQDMEAVESARHPRLGVPIHSLYGESEASLRPRPDWLADLDIVVVDLQDVGSRYYTYIWSALLMMQACSECGVAVLVLDRPNPLGGEVVEGPGIQGGFESFVGRHSIPVRHGLTIGELARLLKHELRLDLDLEVVPMQGWQRRMTFEGTGLPWVGPSPNMPRLSTAKVYPGLCLLEATNLSEGRGTTQPFELIGAPWVDPEALASELRRLHPAEDVSFRPVCFVPQFHKHQGSVCGGIQIHPRSTDLGHAFRLGCAILTACFDRWPNQTRWRTETYEFVDDRLAIDLLAGGDWLRQAIHNQVELKQFSDHWQQYERDFAERRAPFLLYPAMRPAGASA